MNKMRRNLIKYIQFDGFIDDVMFYFYLVAVMVGITGLTKGTKGDKRAISSPVSLFSQTHAWVSRAASHATALNIGIIIFIQSNHK